jgi:DNA modification methylase
MVQRNLSVEYRSLALLKPDPENPRHHSKKQIRQIARSIATLGFNVPVLIDGQGQLIAGHGRFQAAQLLGMTEVPTIKLEHMTEAQRCAFMIADNRLTEKSVWDQRLLGEQLKELSLLDLDFSLEVTGFELDEINLTIEGHAPASREKDDPADTIFESGTKPQVTEAGDLWNLNRHRVYCGDARDDAAYSVLMQSKHAMAVFCSPPCNDRIRGYLPSFGKNPHLESASARMSDGEFTTFLAEVLALLARNSTDGALQYIGIDWRHMPELLAAAHRAYSAFKDLCIWVKDTASQGPLYRSQHELVFVFKSGKGAHRSNIQRGRRGRHRTNVWEYRCVNSSAPMTDENNRPDLHSTVKPVGLIADAILDCTARGDVVLDPFVGSGTTVIAAERTGRICFGLELDPRALDTTIRRWQAFTRQSAIQESTGRTFDEIEEENHGRAR